VRANVFRVAPQNRSVQFELYEMPAAPGPFAQHILPNAKAAKVSLDGLCRCVAFA
jgi:hypothetical protein